MITIRRFGTHGDALAAVVTLQAAGIPAEILHENAIAAVTHTSGGIQLQVSESDVPRAKEVLGREAAVSSGEIQKYGLGFLRGGIMTFLISWMIGLTVIATGGQFESTWVGQIVLICAGGIIGEVFWPLMVEKKPDDEESAG